MLLDNNSPTGSQTTKALPAIILFGRPQNKVMPFPFWWVDTAHMRRGKWSEHTRTLPPLQVEDHVFIQYMTGNQLRRWERTGIVVEVRQYHQYVVRVDNKGRVTLCNRQHLRWFTLFHAKPTVDTLVGHSSTPSPAIGPTNIPRVNKICKILPKRHNQPPHMIRTSDWLPHALSCLQPYNKPGAKELLTTLTRATHDLLEMSGSHEK